MPLASLSVNFLSAAAVAGDFHRRVPTRRRPIPVENTRRVSKRAMLRNQANPQIAIDPATADVTVDGAPLPPLPTGELPLNRRYLLL